jgi:hypothetical protein
MTCVAKKDVSDLMSNRVSEQQSVRQSELLRHRVCTIRKHCGVSDGPETGNGDITPPYAACPASRLRKGVNNHARTSHVTSAGFRSRDVAVGPVHTNGDVRQNVAQDLAGLQYLLRPQGALIVHFQRKQWFCRLASATRGQDDWGGEHYACSSSARP